MLDRKVIQYQCVCCNCGYQRQMNFSRTEAPKDEQVFQSFCERCSAETVWKRVQTKKLLREQKCKEQEKNLRNTIMQLCHTYGFQCRFLYESVIIKTPVCRWQYDYHRAKKTLYHESTTKINFATGNRADFHVQFRDKKISNEDLIAYIAEHDGKQNPATQKEEL